MTRGRLADHVEPLAVGVPPRQCRGEAEDPPPQPVWMHVERIADGGEAKRVVASVGQEPVPRVVLQERRGGIGRRRPEVVEGSSEHRHAQGTLRVPRGARIDLRRQHHEIEKPVGV